MCNFIIRPIKSYATIGVYAFHDDERSGSEFLEVGTVFTPSYIGHTENDVAAVYGTVEDAKALGVEDGQVLGIELDVFVHSFSDKDPNKKSEKTDKK